MRKIMAYLIYLVLPILIGLYLLGSLYHKNKFPSNVYVNEVNIGRMTLKRAEKKLAKTDLFHKLTIKSDSEDFLEIEAEEIEYVYIGNPDLAKIFKKEKERNWLKAFFNDSSYTTPVLSDYNKDKIKSILESMEELDKKLLDASIVYSNVEDAFVIEPHSYEIQITEEELFDLLVQSIEKRDQELNIEKNIEQPSIFEDNKSLIATRDKANEYLDIKIKYDFEDREELIDGSIIKDFIAFKGTELYIDPEKVKDYVAEIARKYDTYGRGRDFITSKGENITISGGSYGWLIHRGETVDALIEHIESKENKTIEPVYSYKALIRNSNDIGNSYVEIDLKEQMVYLYIKGQLEVQTQTVTGDASKGYNTPTGIYPINYKETNATLRGEDYASPVKYWMPFNKDIGLHDADWRTSFGEDIYKTDGSHGCINLPPNNAKSIFDLVYPGMPVIVH